MPRLFPGCTIGRWWYGGKEIDIIGCDVHSGTILFGEYKWGILTQKESRKILESLKKKSSCVRHAQYTEEKFLIVARTVGGKEVLRKEGYLAFDLDDILLVMDK